MRFTYIVFTLIFSALTVTGFAQRLDDKYELGLRVGRMNYQGDLQEKDFTIDGSHFVFGGIFRYQATPRLAPRLVMEVGKISGSDANSKTRQSRGYAFESPIFSFEAGVEFHPFPLRQRNTACPGMRIRGISPYLHGGLGYTNAQSEVTVLKPDTPNPFPEDDVKNNFLIVPFGGGIRYVTGSSVNIAVEANSRYTFGDYLDGVSQYGNPDGGDWFWSITGQVSILLGTY